MKREYRGPPIDLREQYITERPAMSDAPRDDDSDEYWGTSPDDLFDESWEIVPSYIEQGALTEEEENVVQWYFSLNQSRVDSVANYVDWSESKIAAFLYQLLDEGDFSLGPENDEWINESESRQIALDAYLTSENPESASFYKLGDETDGTSGETVKRVVHRVFKDSRTIDDLGTGKQLAIQLWAHHGLESRLTELQREYDYIPKRYFGDAKRIYRDLIEELQPVALEDFEDDLEEYKENKDTTTKSKPSPSPKTGVTKPREEKTYSDLTDNQKKIVDEISKAPDLVATEIADRLGLNHPTGVYDVVKGYPNIVKARIEEVGAVDSVEEIDDNILDKADGLGEWDLGGESDEPEVEPRFERELEIEFEDEFEFDFEDEFESTPIQPSIIEPEEEVVFISRDLSAQAQEYISGTDEYGSVTQLARDAIRKELNGEYNGSADLASENVRTDTIEAVLELADVDPKKADAIRTLISDE